MNQLPPHLASIIERARSAHDPSPTDRERVLAGLLGSLGTARPQGEPGPEIGAGSAPAQTASLKDAVWGAKGGALGAKLMLAGALSLGSVGWWAVSERAAPGARRAAESAHPEAPSVPTAFTPASPSSTRTRRLFARAPEGALRPSDRESGSPGRADGLLDPDVAAAAPELAAQSDRRDQAEAPVQVEIAVPAEAAGRGERDAGSFGVRAPHAPLPRAAAKPHARRRQRDAAAATAARVSEPEQASSQPSGVPSPSPSEQPHERSDELALMRATLTALRDEHGADAMALLEEHARRFPDGVLAHERRGLRVIALCAVGRSAAGRAEQAAFLATDSSSPLAQRVRGACPSGGAR
jgi:hypothetical protein